MPEITYCVVQDGSSRIVRGLLSREEAERVAEEMAASERRTIGTRIRVPEYQVKVDQDDVQFLNMLHNQYRTHEMVSVPSLKGE